MPSAAESFMTIERIKIMVKKYGGQSDELAKLRQAYAFWYAAPGDNMAYALVLNELDRLEKL